MQKSLFVDHSTNPGTRTIIQGTAYRYGTFHPEMPQKYRNFQTCPNIGKLWHFGNISVVRKLHQKKLGHPEVLEINFIMRCGVDKSIGNRKSPLHPKPFAKACHSSP